MRFMMMVKATKDFEAGLPPPPGLVNRVEELIREMAQKGILESAEGLLPSSHGMLVQCVNGERRVIDGPFSESKEVVGGFAILNVPSKSDAIAMANRMVDLHLAFDIRDVEIEVRPIAGP